MSERGDRPWTNDPTANEDSLPRGDAVLTEQRRNLSRQVAELRQIDQTAARTVRIAAIIVGFIIAAATAVSQTNQSPAPSALLLSGVGIIFLLVTIVLGVDTLGGTEYKTRLTEGEYMRLSKPYPPDGSERAALRKYYRDWSKRTAGTLKENSEQLASVQRSLTLGVMLVAASGFAQLYGQMLGDALLSVAASSLVVVLMISLVLRLITPQQTGDSQQ